MINPSQIRLETSTKCQLKCPTCPTATGATGIHLGTGFLRFSDFRQFITSNPHITSIELSNWGEVFLNRDIVPILRYAHEHNITLTLYNGTNLNSLKAGVAEALVKYQLRFINVSIDGASQETYARYRVNGDWEKVIENVRQINHWKQVYQSPYPILQWQFVIFGHNEHELHDARAMATELGMDFHLKLAWDDLYGESFSPVRDRDRVRRESGLDVADRAEFREKYGVEYAGIVCLDLWRNPQVNYDGRLLGCAINYREDYGNVFEQGLVETLNNEKISYAREMLMGRKPARAGIPCTDCPVFSRRRQYADWVTDEQIAPVQPAPTTTPAPTVQAIEKCIPSQGCLVPLNNEVDPQAPWKPVILLRGQNRSCEFFQCHVSGLNPGHIPHPPHAHADEEILVMLSGQAQLILPDSDTDGQPQAGRLPVARGDFVYYPAYHGHSLQAIGSEPANYLMLKWKNSQMRAGDNLQPQHFNALDLFSQIDAQQGFGVNILFARQTAYLAQLHCHLSVLSAGAGYAEHIDDHDVVIVVLEGEIETIGRRFGPNTVIYYASGEPHGMSNSSQQDARYIVFEFHRNT